MLSENEYFDAGSYSHIKLPLFNRYNHSYNQTKELIFGCMALNLIISNIIELILGVLAFIFANNNNDNECSDVKDLLLTMGIYIMSVISFLIVLIICTYCCKSGILSILYVFITTLHTLAIYIFAGFFIAAYIKDGSNCVNKTTFFVESIVIVVLEVIIRNYGCMSGCCI